MTLQVETMPYLVECAKQAAASRTLSHSRSRRSEPYASECQKAFSLARLNKQDGAADRLNSANEGDR